MWLAWVWLYRKFPRWQELVCIVIHDWGYWGKANMDDEAGERHPEWAARWAREHLDIRLLGWFYPSQDEYHDLCLYHSRHYARHTGQEPSRLCWADKYSIVFDPWWMYLPRAWMTGELTEYRRVAAAVGLIPITASHREWHREMRRIMVCIAHEQRGDAVPYSNTARR